MKHTASFLLIFFFINSSWSQISEKGTPETWKKSHRGHLYSLKDGKVLPSFDVKKLQYEDSINDLEKNIAPRFAYAHEVDYNTSNSGEWTTTNEGVRVWRLYISSPGAYSLNFTFSKFHLPEEGKLFIYSQTVLNNDLIGAFTSRNNQPSKVFSTVPVRGDAVIIEYNAPVGTELPELELSHVAHDYRNFFGILKNFGDAGVCNIDVACAQGDTVRDQISSVALNINESGTRWCSGAMIANSRMDDTPYYLTAYHCLPGNQANVANWVFVFNYESPTCSGGDGSLTQSISGSSLVASNLVSDFALLELSSPPPDSYNAFYSGWNRSTTPATHAFGVHHPSGDVKKISTYNQATIVDNSFAPMWRVDAWTEGTTEGGSSGSPLYDEHKRIVGQLYGGQAACQGAVDNDLPDYYGRLDASWTGNAPDKRLRDWLDPDSTGAIIQDGYDPYAVSVKEFETIQIVAYPNPADQSIRFRTLEKNGNYQLIDLTGRKVKEGVFQNGTGEITVDELSNGAYQLLIRTGNQAGTTAILIQH